MKSLPRKCLADFRILVGMQLRLLREHPCTRSLTDRRSACVCAISRPQAAHEWSHDRH
jgi:hypothetical protein